MSQKTNPTGLRLQKNNQNFSCPGFADFFFTENYHYGFEIENYVSAFLRQTQYSKAFFSAKNQYRNYSVWLFLQDSRVDKTEKQSFLKYKSFNRSNLLKKHSKLTVFQMLQSSKEKNLSSYFLKQKKNKDLLSKWPQFLQNSFINKAGRSTPDTLGLLSSLSLPSNESKLPQHVPQYAWQSQRHARDLSYLNDKSSYSQLQHENTQDNYEKDGKESKENKREWVRKSYTLVSLFSLCSRSALKKYYQKSFPDSEDNFYKNGERNLFFPCYFLKGDFRKIVVNEFLRTKQNKAFYTKAKQLKKTIDLFKLRPKYLGELELKNSTPFIENGSLAGKMMPNVFRSNCSSPYFFNHSCYGDNFSFAKVRLCKTIKKRKEDKTVKVEKVSNARYIESRSNSNKNSLCLEYHLDSVDSVFKSQNHTQQSNFKFPAIVDLQPIRFIKDQQNVMSLLNQIVILLENRVSFRQIKSFVSKDFSNFSKHFHLKGLRIACSGRLGGRSKKAQKAKMQCASFGQTSLSAFSSKLIFRSQSAHTPSGLIGVKLWLCFKNTRF